MTDPMDGPIEPSTTSPDIQPEEHAARDAVRQLMEHDQEPASAAGGKPREKRSLKFPRLKRSPADRVMRRGLGRRLLDRIGAALRAPLHAAAKRVRGYRPTRLHVTLAVLALIVVMRPWLIPILVFVLVLTFVITYLTLGPDRFAEVVVAAWMRLHRWRPVWADKLREKYEKGSERFDAFLTRLPAGWGDRVSLPGSRSKAAAAMENAPDPFERLAEEARRDQDT